MKTSLKLLFLGALLAANLYVSGAAIATMGHAAPAGKALTTFDTDDFSGSGNCAVCHTNLRDRARNDVSIDSHWRSTMMANAARDPFWLAKVSSEATRNPELRAVIEEKCATCHTPMARTQAIADGDVVAVLGKGFLNEKNRLHDAAMDGVSCTLCHQIQDINLGEESSFSGNYRIDTSTFPPTRLVYGPFTKPMPNPMARFSGFTPVYGSHTLESELCAVCHTLFTPYVDNSGEVRGYFPEQTPYLEWEQSDYARSGKESRSCQECHMPAAVGTVRISNLGGKGRGRSPFAQHHFVGGNVFMLELLKSQNNKLGLTASSKNFDDTISRILAQLKNSTAEISIKKSSASGGTLFILVKVENKAGHKFPTGFPSRRAWIELLVTDAGGNTVFHSGGVDKDGSITGCDADAGSRSYEIHYDVIKDPSQVQIYESVMDDTDGQVTYTLLRGASYKKDNRLLPAGFRKKKASPETAVCGEATKDKNFVGGSDQIAYKIDVSPHSGPFTVTAWLQYQTISYVFLQDLVADETKEVKKFLRYSRSNKNIPTEIAYTQKTVE